MNGLRLRPGDLRMAAATLAHRVTVAISLIFLALGVALAGTMLPWAVGQLGPGQVPVAALGRLVVGTGLPAPGEREQRQAALASNDGSAVSEAVTLTAGAAVLRTTGRDGE